jgi:hypothetical protein
LHNSSAGISAHAASQSSNGQTNQTEDPQSVHVASGLTEQQKKRIAEHREAAISKKSRIRYDPLAEHLDDQPVDDWEYEGGARSHAAQVGDENPDETAPSGRPPNLREKHSIASAKLKEVKKAASAKWQEHIQTSTRVKQHLMEPDILDDPDSGGPMRFTVHESHRLMALRSVVFCKACGYWAAKKSQKLRSQCIGKPAHADGAQKLRRLLKGLHPDSKLKQWPDGHDARVASQPVAIDWHSSPV